MAAALYIYIGIFKKYRKKIKIVAVKYLQFIFQWYTLAMYHWKDYILFSIIGSFVPMNLVLGDTVFSVSSNALLAVGGVVVQAASPAVWTTDLDFFNDSNIVLTSRTSDIYLNPSRDFSVACDPLAHAGVCISLLVAGDAECNWQELMNCRLSFSVCAASILPKTSRKLQKSQFRTAFRAEKFVAARRKFRQEVLRL